MQPFTVHAGRAVALRRENVDTDQIVPAQFLTSTARSGFGAGLFARWRGEDGFPLERPEHAGASILLAGADFGTGSSREHAVWALMEGGFRVVVSPRFADIFRSNALKNGLLPVELPAHDVERLMALVERAPGSELVVDLRACELRADGIAGAFAIGERDRERLLEGLDEIALTERRAAAIEAFEHTRPAWLPRTA